MLGGGYVTYTQPVIEPLYQSRSDTDIIFDLSRRLELEDPLMNSDYDTCLRYMLRDNPEIDLESCKREPYPIHVEASFYQPGSWKFKTPTGKFEIWSKVIEQYEDRGYTPIPTWLDPLEGDGEAYPFVMCSGARRGNVLHSRLHDVPWLRSLHPEPTVEINTEDAAALGISRGDLVEVFTDVNTITLKAEVTEFTRKGTLNTYHGYREADCNSLMRSRLNDPYSGFPAFKSYRCGIRKKVTV